MSKLLLNEPPLVVQPTLAVKLGLNEALVLQQIHYWAAMKLNLKDGYYWVYNTYEDWAKQFPFMSKSTIGRVLRNLEKDKVIVVGNYNKLSFDKTKWYRIDYNELKKYEDNTSQDGFVNPVSDIPKSNHDDVKLVSSRKSERVNNTIDYTKTSTDIKDIVEPKAQQPSPIPKIVEYLNTVANKKFKPNTSATTKLLNARLSDGYTLQEIKYVIDNKTAEWLNTDMQKYLRPETLFNATKFESYVNEPPYKPKKSKMDAVQDIMNMSFEQREVERIEQERNHAIDRDDTNLLPW